MARNSLTAVTTGEKPYQVVLKVYPADDKSASPTAWKWCSTVLQEEGRQRSRDARLTNKKGWLKIQANPQVIEAQSEKVSFGYYEGHEEPSHNRQNCVDWNLPVNTAVISSDLWVDISTDPGFVGFYSEIEKHNIVLEGFLGTILGVQVITDAFREPHLKVLNRGSLAMFSTPNTLGGLMERAGVTCKNIDNYAAGRNERGWFISTVESMSLVNSRGVCMGQRV